MPVEHLGVGPATRRRLLGASVVLGAQALLRLPPPAIAATDPLSQVIALTNQQRQQAGLSPLASNASLMQAAGSYAAVLATSGCWGHTCGPVPDLAQRDQNAGYLNWTALGENIAAGYSTPDAVVAGWMGSPEHRANILNPAYVEIGVGFAAGGSMGSYWVQEFGARAGVVAPPTSTATSDAGTAPASLSPAASAASAPVTAPSSAVPAAAPAPATASSVPSAAPPSLASPPSPSAVVSAPAQSSAPSGASVVMTTEAHAARPRASRATEREDERVVVVVTEQEQARLVVRAVEREAPARPRPITHAGQQRNAQPTTQHVAAPLAPVASHRVEHTTVRVIAYPAVHPAPEHSRPVVHPAIRTSHPAAGPGSVGHASSASIVRRPGPAPAHAVSRRAVLVRATPKVQVHKDHRSR